MSFDYVLDLTADWCFYVYLFIFILYFFMEPDINNHIVDLNSQTPYYKWKKHKRAK